MNELKKKIRKQENEKEKNIYTRHTQRKHETKVKETKTTVFLFLLFRLATTEIKK